MNSAELSATWRKAHQAQRQNVHIAPPSGKGALIVVKQAVLVLRAIRRTCLREILKHRARDVISTCMGASNAWTK